MNDGCVRRKILEINTVTGKSCRMRGHGVRRAGAAWLVLLASLIGLAHAGRLPEAYMQATLYDEIFGIWPSTVLLRAKWIQICHPGA